MRGWVLVAACALLCGGCSGVRVGQSVSPLNFLLPGFTALPAASPAPVAAPAPAVPLEVASRAD